MSIADQQTASFTPDIPSTFQTPTDSYDYAKREVMIPMRDGVRLYTVIVVPKGARNAPMLLTRTPYNAASRAERNRSPHMWPRCRSSTSSSRWRATSAPTRTSAGSTSPSSYEGFPLYDRNPQTFVPNILFATPDYAKATERVYHSRDAASSIDRPIVAR